LLRYGDQEADAREMLQLMSMGVQGGAEITLTADGDDAQETIAAIARLFLDNFGFDD
jgi:phosphocarrier protein